MRALFTCLALVWPHAVWPQVSSAAGPPKARIMFLGLFHSDNPGGDAVKYAPIDVSKPGPQAYLRALAERLARFKPTRVLLEYPVGKDDVFRRRFADFLLGRFELPKNEIYQIGFRVAQLSGLDRVYGFDTSAPSQEVKLWAYLGQEPKAEARLMTMIASESRRLQGLHETKSLQDILVLSTTREEDLRNKGFYMLLNAVGVERGLFHGADASADWCHRNLRMHALIQHHASAGERVLVIAGSGHTAVLRDFLRADGDRAEEDVLGYLSCRPAPGAMTR